MLLGEYLLEDCVDCLIWCMLIHYQQIPFFARQVVDFLVDTHHLILVQFSLAPKYRLRTRTQQHIIIERWDYQLSIPVQEPRRQIDTASSAVADDVREITVENDQPSDSRMGLHLQEVTHHVIHRIIRQSEQ